jgi:hypothetical protein
VRYKTRWDKRPKKTSRRWGIMARTRCRKPELPGSRVDGLCPRCRTSPDHYDAEVASANKGKYLTTLRFYTNGMGVLFEECSRCDYSSKV